MYSLATSTATIHRGTVVTTDYGDTVDGVGEIVATGVLVSIQQSSARVWDPATQTMRVVRTWLCSIQSDQDVRTNDILIEENGAQRTYQVTDIVQTGGPFYTSDLTASLKTIDLGVQGG